MDTTFLAKTPLFSHISPQEIQSRMTCIGGVLRSFPKGTYIHYAGNVVHTVSMIIKGSVIMEHDDLWGNRTLLGKAVAGELFAEAYACTENEPLMISVMAVEDTTVLMMDLSKVLHTCSRNCPQHQQISENLLRILAGKNLALSRRILHTSSKSIRGRVLSYLSFLSAKQGKKIITVPFNRQQMADYLGVDRSALSGELSKMQKDGLLEYHKESFKLLQDPEA